MLASHKPEAGFLQRRFGSACRAHVLANAHQPDAVRAEFPERLPELDPSILISGHCIPVAAVHVGRRCQAMGVSLQKCPRLQLPIGFAQQQPYRLSVSEGGPPAAEPLMGDEWSSG